jgi:hypothetical protein
LSTVRIVTDALAELISRLDLEISVIENNALCFREELFAGTVSSLHPLALSAVSESADYEPTPTQALMTE